MKKYLLLYISLSFFISPLAWSMAGEDDYGSESDQDGNFDQDEGSEPMQNGMLNMQPDMAFQNGGMMMNQGMMQQPGMLPQNGMMMNQNNSMSMPNNMMMQQPGMLSQNGMMPQNGMMNQGMMPQNRMMNQMDNPENLWQDDETSKKEYVQSLVQKLLNVGGKRKNRDFQDGEDYRDLKNKFFKLQKDLNEISRSLNGIADEEESFAGGSSKKSKSSVSAKTKSSKKSTTASKSSSTKAKSSRKSRSSKYKKYRSRSRTYSRNKKFSKFNRPKSFYTVKQLTPQNAVKYVPKYYYSGYNATVNEQQAVPTKAISYKVKNWGTGEVVPEETYYYKNFQNSYFSNKSKCENSCGTH